MTKSELERELVRILKEQSEYLIPSHSAVFNQTVSELAEPFKQAGMTKVMAIDMKGIMYGPIVAQQLGAPFVPILKRGKITNPTKALPSPPFIDYSGKPKSIEIFKGSLGAADKVLLVDDWFETGNTARAAIALIRQTGATVAGLSVIFNQLKPQDEVSFAEYNYRYIVRLDPEDRIL